MALNYEFEAGNIVEANKISDEMLKRLNREDPRSALMALGICTVFAMRACKLKRAQVAEMLQIVENSLDFHGGAAQAALSNLTLPR